MNEEKSKAPEGRVELLKMISQPVMMEVHYEIYSRVLLAHQFFLCYNDVNPAGVRKVCHTAISTLSLHSRDVLFSDLEVPEKPKMFFIISGGLDYMHDKVISRVDKGHYLCEQTLWTRWTHVGTARAHTETRIVILDAKKFADICSTFP